MVVLTERGGREVFILRSYESYQPKYYLSLNILKSNRAAHGYRIAMNNIKAKLTTDTFLIKGSIAFFAINIGVAYFFYPHWVTFSYLALQAYSLPFFLCAMAVTIFLLCHTGKRLRSQELHKAGIAMYISAACVGLVVLIPYKGSETQIALHNLAALLFVLCAAAGLTWLARKLQDRLLGISAALQVGICIMELILLIRFERHPVEQWVWVVLQLIVTFLLMVSFVRIFSTLESLKLKDS